MSLAALTLATRDTLQQAFNLTADSCEVGFDGQPKPTAGQRYLAVFPGSWGGVSDDNDLSEDYGVNVTVSMRLGTAPKDRWGIEVWAKAQVGLEAVCRQIAVKVHKNYDLMNLANQYIQQLFTAQTYWLLFHPLELVDGGSPRLVGPDWFGETLDANVQVQNYGVMQAMRFGKASRAQAHLEGEMS